MAHLPNVELSNETWNETKASVVAVGVFQDTSLTPMASHINEAADGLFSKAIEMGDVKGKEGESKLFYVDGKRVQLLGLGKKEEFDQETIRMVAGLVSRSAIKNKIDDVAIECFSNEDDMCQALAEGLVLGSYQFLDYKTTSGS